MSGANFSKIHTFADGDTLTAAQLNAEVDNILNNLNPAGMAGQSADAATMRSTTDPYPAGAESLAASLMGEILRLRYIIQQITGKTYWYQDPAVSLESIGPPDATLTALAALTITQGSLITGTGTDAFSVLAKGTAGQKLFMNLAGTSPEWATGHYIGTLSRPMDGGNGDESTHHDANFKPSVVIFIAIGPASISVGFDDQATHYGIYTYGLTGSWGGGNASISLYQDPANYQAGTIKTLDSTGFTLTWAKTGTPASSSGTVYYLALR